MADNISAVTFGSTSLPAWSDRASVPTRTLGTQVSSNDSGLRSLSPDWHGSVRTTATPALVHATMPVTTLGVAPVTALGSRDPLAIRRLASNHGGDGGDGDISGTTSGESLAASDGGEWAGRRPGLPLAGVRAAEILGYHVRTFGSCPLPTGCTRDSYFLQVPLLEAIEPAVDAPHREAWDLHLYVGRLDDAEALVWHTDNAHMRIQQIYDIVGRLNRFASIRGRLDAMALAGVHLDTRQHVILMGALRSLFAFTPDGVQLTDIVIRTATMRHTVPLRVIDDGWLCLVRFIDGHRALRVGKMYVYLRRQDQTEEDHNLHQVRYFAALNVSVGRTPLWKFRFIDTHITLGHVVVDEANVPPACWRDDRQLPYVLEDPVHRVGEVLWREAGVDAAGDTTTDAYMFWDHVEAWRGVTNVERGAYFQVEPSGLYRACMRCVEVLGFDPRSDLRRGFHFSVRDALFIQAAYALHDPEGGMASLDRPRRRTDGSWMDDDGPSSYGSGADP